MSEAAPFEHQPVLLSEAIAHLALHPGATCLDATIGGGGHAEAILEAIGPAGRLIGIDRDPAALKTAGRRLARFGRRIELVHALFSQLAGVLAELDIGRVDAILADLGVSSPQLDRPERGFSFTADGPLDMRMDPETGSTAADLINESSVEELVRIFRDYGEERHAARYARAIERARRVTPIKTTRQLASLVERHAPRPAGRHRIHPATRVFQALRIKVNDELEELSAGLAASVVSLSRGGRLVVISFHSLEDRIVKRFFRYRAAECVCPPEMPFCQCSKESELEILTPKPVTAGPQEMTSNPRARSAKLRAARKRV